MSEVFKSRYCKNLIQKTCVSNVHLDSLENSFKSPKVQRTNNTIDNRCRPDRLLENVTGSINKDSKSIVRFLEASCFTYVISKPIHNDSKSSIKFEDPSCFTYVISKLIHNDSKLTIGFEDWPLHAYQIRYEFVNYPIPESVSSRNHRLCKRIPFWCRPAYHLINCYCFGQVSNLYKTIHFRNDNVIGVGV